jgi:hypothetical protein
MGFTNRAFSVPLANMDKYFWEGRSFLEAHGELDRHLVGGQPATEPQLRAYIEHWLKIDPASPEFQKTFDRIRKEELGHVEPEKPEGELEDKKVYGINCLRRDERGVYILNHMVQAMIKQTASRLGLMMIKKGNLGSKGDLAEMGKVQAIGKSLIDPAGNWKIYAFMPDGSAPKTHYETLRGSVQTANGRMSIMYDAEMLDAGAQFEFRFSWASGRLTCEDLARVIINTQNVGLGSGRSLGFGRFRLVKDLTGEDAVKDREQSEDKPKKAKKAKEPEAQPVPTK